MKATVPSTVPHRPHIRRVNPKELEDTRFSNEWETSYGSSGAVNRYANQSQSYIPPSRNNSWRPKEQPPRNPPNTIDDDNQNKCWIGRGWMICFGGIFCLILIIAIVAIVLGIVLPMTTAAPDSNATPRMALVNTSFSMDSICSNTDLGLIANLNGTVPTQWTLYTYNYTATTTTPTVFFGFETNLAHIFYLDAVSIVDINLPSLELLNNPNFENSTINPIGWNESCDTTCTDEILISSQCSGGASGNCFKVTCPNDNYSIFFLSQSFQAIIGNTYIVSFMFRHQENSNVKNNSFYLNII